MTLELCFKSYIASINLVNYPFAKDKWASGFTDLCFSREVLFESPPVLSTVPADIIFNPSLRRFFAAFSYLSCKVPQELPPLYKRQGNLKNFFVEFL